MLDDWVSGFYGAATGAILQDPSDTLDHPSREFELTSRGMGGGVSGVVLFAARCLPLFRRLLLLVALLPPWVAEEEESAERPQAPHIVVFLADDMGWGDAGFNGGTIPTSNLDRLAKEGVRLDQFYVQPRCTPTRGALLTGCYPMRLGLQTGVVRPCARPGLPLGERTLPEALREAGYATAICGKWHLGHHRSSCGW